MTERHPFTLQDGVFEATYDDDKLREECGVFGIFQHNEAASLTALGLHALQHRGEEACGIAATDGEEFHLERHLGLVGENFHRRSVLERLTGHAAIGHNRYSTTGDTILRNVQPLFAELSTGGFAIAHNGNLTNHRILKNDLVAQGAIFQSTSDTEVVLHLVSRSREKRLVDRFIDALRQIEGAYGFVALTDDMLIGARDPVGIRPLVLGKLEGSYVLASETCALDMIGAKFVREIENGEVVVITRDGIESLRPFENKPARPCVFEFIYFARPDSMVGGHSVYEIRQNMGRQLAAESPVDVDVIVPIPDSGVPAALGYAEQAGVPFGFGIIRNHYIGRTFIQPEQRIRELGVRRKHAANAGVLRGKRIVLIDDSVVRGTTSRQIVQLVRDAGAREVHMRIASPPIIHSDYYGIDTPREEDLFAARYTLEQMCKSMGADSLAFLSVNGIYRAIGIEGGRNGSAPQLSDHCFTGEYPTALLDLEEFGKAGSCC
ncbi:MAG: amidophosphoribosyltransferase [Alphaproteobacteria bacterium]|nr:amidophosphoribosyltransferase [Alphaproteobacteria bacterium]